MAFVSVRVCVCAVPCLPSCSSARPPPSVGPTRPLKGSASLRDWRQTQVVKRPVCISPLWRSHVGRVICPHSTRVSARLIRRRDYDLCNVLPGKAPYVRCLLRVIIYRRYKRRDAAARRERNVSARLGARARGVSVPGPSRTALHYTLYRTRTPSRHRHTERSCDIVRPRE